MTKSTKCVVCGQEVGDRTFIWVTDNEGEGVAVVHAMCLDLRLQRAPSSAIIYQLLPKVEEPEEDEHQIDLF